VAAACDAAAFGGWITTMSIRRMIVGYLLVSSVLLHLGLAAGGIYAWSWMKEMSEAWSPSAQGNKSAVVRDISELSDGEYSYCGYALDYEGKPLYLTGSADSCARVGDTVNLSIAKHPYGPIKTMMITVSSCKKEPQSTAAVPLPQEPSQ